MLKSIYHIVASLLPAILLGISASAWAAVDKVSGTYTYYGDSSTSREQAEERALEGARLDALANKYGRKVNGEMIIREVEGTDAEARYVDYLSSTEVGGEWIADEGKPEYKHWLDAEDNRVVRCTIKGTARPRTNQSVEFKSLTLANGTTDRYATSSYKEGDALMISFRAPCDGYVAVFIIDSQNWVSTMLPDADDPFGALKVKGNRDYVFFSENDRSPEMAGEVMEYVMTLDQPPVERDMIYVVFSPNEFSKPLDTHVTDPKVIRPNGLTLHDFNTWKSKICKNDPRVSFKKHSIDIRQN